MWCSLCCLVIDIWILWQIGNQLAVVVENTSNIFSVFSQYNAAAVVGLVVCRTRLCNLLVRQNNYISEHISPVFDFVS